MKAFLNILLFFNSLQLLAVNRYDITKCLGRVELEQHRTRDASPAYDITQILLNELLLLEHSTVKESSFKKQCSKKINPSIDIYKSLILYPESSFAKLPGSSVNQFKADISNFKLKVPELYNKITLLFKKLVPPKCLDKKFQWFKLLEKKIFHLSTHKEISLILREERKVSEVFEILKNPRKAYSICSGIKRSPNNKVSQ